MAFIEEGYVAVQAGHGPSKTTTAPKRKWWTVKYCAKCRSGKIDLGKIAIFFPEEYIGKRVRLKVEVI